MQLLASEEPSLIGQIREVFVASESGIVGGFTLASVTEVVTESQIRRVFVAPDVDDREQSAKLVPMPMPMTMFTFGVYVINGTHRGSKSIHSGVKPHSTVFAAQDK